MAKHSFPLDSLESTINNFVTQHQPPLKLVLKGAGSDGTDFRFVRKISGRKRLLYFGNLKFIQSPCSVIRKTDIVFQVSGDFYRRNGDTGHDEYVTGNLTFAIRSDCLAEFMDTVTALVARKKFPTLDDEYGRQAQVFEFNEEGAEEGLDEDEVKELHGIV